MDFFLCGVIAFFLCFVVYFMDWKMILHVILMGFFMWLLAFYVSLYTSWIGSDEAKITCWSSFRILRGTLESFFKFFQFSVSFKLFIFTWDLLFFFYEMQSWNKPNEKYKWANWKQCQNTSCENFLIWLWP